MNATWHSTTPTVKPVSNDRQYYFLPYWDEKPTMWIRATFPDHRRRLYNSNVIGKPADKLVCSLLYCFALILYYWHFTPMQCYVQSLQFAQSTFREAFSIWNFSSKKAV